MSKTDVGVPHFKALKSGAVHATYKYRQQDFTMCRSAGFSTGNFDITEEPLTCRPCINSVAKRTLALAEEETT